MKVHLSVTDHRKTVRLFADPELRGIWLGILIKAGEKYAGKTNDTVLLTHGDLTFISGRSYRHLAIKLVRSCCDLCEWPVSDDGEVVAITIRNFSKKQYFTPQLRSGDARSTPGVNAEERGIPPPSDSDLLSSSKTQKKEADSDSDSAPQTPHAEEAADQPSAGSGNGADHEAANGRTPDSVPVSVEEVVSEWNEVMVPLGFTAVREITQERRENVSAILSRTADVGTWNEFFDRLSKSPVMNGRTSADGWRPGFDWVFDGDETKWARILEGSYSHAWKSRAGAAAAR